MSDQTVEQIARLRLPGLLQMVRRKQGSRVAMERWTRYLASSLILMNLTIAGFIVSVLAGDDSAMQLGYPAGFTIAAKLTPISSAATLVLLVGTVGLWRRKTIGISTRLSYLLVVLAAIYFLWYLSEVNILQWPLVS